MNRCVVLTSLESEEERIWRRQERTTWPKSWERAGERLLLPVVMGRESPRPASQGSYSAKGSERIKTQQ